VRRGSGVDGRGGGASGGGASARGGVSDVRLKSKSARSEVAGVAMLNGAISPQMCVASCCSLLHLEEVEELTASRAPSTAARRLMILGTPLPRFVPSQKTISESNRPQSQTLVLFPGQIGQARITDRVTR
jgi:hypothetical protein